MQVLKRINEALPGLVAGILIWAALTEVIGVWFYPDKLRYTTGVLFGAGCAIGAAIHLALMIEKSIACGGEGKAQRSVNIKSGLRALVIFAVLGAMIYFNLGWWGSAFISLLGLKMGAYAQPTLKKINTKIKRRR